MAMERVSGTIWERFVAMPLWILLIFGSFMLLMRESVVVVLTSLGFIAGLFLLIDEYRYSKYHLAIVYCGDRLLINGAEVLVEDVVWLRQLELLGVRNQWTFIEIVFLREGHEERALCMGKPDRLLHMENKTISLMLKKHPELADKVQPGFSSGSDREIKEPPRPFLNGEDQEQQPRNPMARYRDPYFRRKR